MIHNLKKRYCTCGRRTTRQLTIDGRSDYCCVKCGVEVQFCRCHSTYKKPRPRQLWLFPGVNHVGKANVRPG